MIEVHKLNGKSLIVNADLIRCIESAGDTVIVFIDGQKLLVREQPRELVEKVIQYRMSIGVKTSWTS